MGSKGPDIDTGQCVWVCMDAWIDGGKDGGCGPEPWTGFSPKWPDSKLLPPQQAESTPCALHTVEMPGWGCEPHLFDLSPYS